MLGQSIAGCKSWNTVLRPISTPRVSIVTHRVSHPPSQAMPLLARFRTRAPPPTRLHNPSPSHSQKQDRIPVWCLRAHLQLWPGACRWVVVCLSSRHPFCKGTTKGRCSLRDLHSFWLAISWKTSTFFVHTLWLDWPSWHAQKGKEIKGQPVKQLWKFWVKRCYQKKTRSFPEQRTTSSTVVEIASNQNRRPSKHLQT